jgi:hypothetical protein
MFNLKDTGKVGSSPTVLQVSYLLLLAGGTFEDMRLFTVYILPFSALLFTVVTASNRATKQEPLLDSPFHSEAASDWSFNFSSAAPHYFSSVQGLLQQWPNTFFPNGHAISVGTISPFTKLYHGREDSDPPPSPEWLAFDIGMSFGIMGSSRNSHMLTYQTTRSVFVLYFDGESATLFGTGQMDTQMLHIYGNTTGRPSRGGFGGLWEEYARAIGLCDWLDNNGLGGPGWGIEGVVRMNAGFELIWCNFTSPSLRLISHLNVSAPLLSTPPGESSISRRNLDKASGIRATDTYYPLPSSPTRSDKAVDPTNPAKPPNWRNDQEREPFLVSQVWGWFTSATDHYGSSGLGQHVGENRVKIDSCGIMSYYNPIFQSAGLARSAVEQKALNLTSDGSWKGEGQNGTRKMALLQLMRRRRTHNLAAINPADALTMRKATERVFRDLSTGNRTQCSGINWATTTNEIVQEYASGLISFRDMLHSFPQLSPTNYTAARIWMAMVRELTHSFLLPFLEYPSGGHTEKVWADDAELSRQTFARCKYHHTRLLVPEEGIILGPEETTMKWAVEETMGSICRVSVSVGFSIEKIWEREFNFNATISGKWHIGQELKNEGKRWTQGVEELMAWLGWAGQWTRCEQVCKWDEKCYIPMWPLINMRRRSSVADVSDTSAASHVEGVEMPSDLDDEKSPGEGPSEGPPGDGDGWGPPDGGYRGPGEPGRWPGYRPGYGYGGRRPGGPPGWGMMDDTDLWEPKCVNVKYLMS